MLGPQSRVRRFVAVVSPIVAVAALLGACGSGPNNETSKSAAQILADAEKATGNASSVHVSGSGTVNSLPLKIDVVAGRGRGGGSITASGSVFNLVLDKQKIFIKADLGTIQALTDNAAIAQAEANHWLQTTTASTLSSLTELLDITKLPQSVALGGNPVKQPGTKFAGVAAIPLFDATSGSTVYVATSGDPHIVGIKGSADSGGTTLTFSEYGSAKIPSDPTDAITLAPSPTTTTAP